MSYYGYNGVAGAQSFAKYLNRFIGETVTIFTASGGVSGCGFTGVVLSVNCGQFVRLVTDQGTAPACPIGGTCCPEFDTPGVAGVGGPIGVGGLGPCPPKPPYPPHPPVFTVGAVCDIPIDKIVAFCHNAV